MLSSTNVTSQFRDVFCAPLIPINRVFYTYSRNIPPGTVAGTLLNRWLGDEQARRRDKSPDQPRHKFRRTRDKASKRHPDWGSSLAGIDSRTYCNCKLLINNNSSSYSGYLTVGSVARITRSYIHQKCRRKGFFFHKGRSGNYTNFFPLEMYIYS